MDNKTQPKYFFNVPGTAGQAPTPGNGIRVSKALVWGVIIVLSIAAMALAVAGFVQSTLTYGVGAVGADTTAQLARIRTALAAAGAPQEALQKLDIATQPGLNIGDAIEALVSADKALDSASGDAAIAAAQRDLRAILQDLQMKRYGSNLSVTPAAGPTPLPTLVIP
jgi:hypothetical protein